MMIKKILKYFVLSLILLSNGQISLGQSVQEQYLQSELQERSIDTAVWRQVIEGINYNQEEKVEREDYDEDFSDESTTRDRSTRDYPEPGANSSFWAGFFKFLLIAFVAVVIALVVAHFMGAGTFLGPTNRRFANENTHITIENVEEYIHESDLDRFIREAVEQGEYALAIRLYYLAIIKELSLHRMIKWKRDKTNKDYLSEMRNNDLFPSFREATRIFERIWYGDGVMQEADYLKVKPKFEALVKAVQQPK